MTGGNVTMAYPVAAESPGFLTALVVPSLTPASQHANASESLFIVTQPNASTPRRS